MLPGNFSLKTVKIQGNVIDDSPEINFIVRLDELKIQPTFQRTIINVMTWDFGELAVRVDRASSRFSVIISIFLI